jgi:uncharacterized protein (TIGR00299 family) protein
MVLGALVDAGLSPDDLRSGLASLNVAGYDLRVEQVRRAGIAATQVRVVLDEKDQPARHLADILAIIDHSSLPQTVKDKSGRIFTRLAEAEAKVHGTTIDRVHFHEVGAVDAIVDIVGSVLGLERLGVTAVSASAVNVGSGTVRTSHGILPVPAPATAELLKGVPFHASTVAFELATPTGAAIVTTLAQSFGPLPQMTATRIAYGAGNRDLPDQPNVLRLFLGEAAPAYDEDDSVLIESNIDDMNPQVYGHVVDRFLQAGAHDAFLVPVIMKKGRPGILLSILTDAAKQDGMLDILFRETTSIGVRIRSVGRRKLSREIRTVETAYGPVRIKMSSRGDEVLTVTPEYEDCRRIANGRNVPLRAVMDEAIAAARRLR